MRGLAALEHPEARPGLGSRDCWFNNTAYASPTNGTFGNVGRNSLSGPGAFTLDTALSRKFIFSETKELALRLDTFNLLNHPVLGNPVTSLNNTANVGRIQTQNGFGRTFQAAVKFSF